MSLAPFCGRHFFDEIQLILKFTEHRVDLSATACRRWARDFVSGIVPGWRPGQALTLEQAQRVGALYERKLAMAKELRGFE